MKENLQAADHQIIAILMENNLNSYSRADSLKGMLEDLSRITLYVQNELHNETKKK